MMIRTKLTLSITLLISIAIAVISSIIGYKVHKIAEYNAQIIAKETAHHYAKYVRAELEIPLDEARAVANLFETASHIKSLQITRAKIKLWLKHIHDKAQWQMEIPSQLRFSTMNIINF
jgi:5-bromo-4-chloroindolyl phosphate hydrolysis protein